MKSAEKILEEVKVLCKKYAKEASELEDELSEDDAPLDEFGEGRLSSMSRMLNDLYNIIEV